MQDGVRQHTQPDRGLTCLYVATVVLLAVALLGAWFWTVRNRWWFEYGEAQQRQAEASRSWGLPVETLVSIGGRATVDLVLIPSGHFRMGTQTSQVDDQDNGYQWVRISSPFYIGKHEVTQEVWKTVMGTNPSYFSGDGKPVDTVSWDDCQEFLRKVNTLIEGQEVLRLPTEAEWEWACRAGTRTQFSFGDERGRLEEYAWYADNSNSMTHAIGQKQPNAWGLRDCHGNVWEWCGDWYENYACSWKTLVDPAGPPAGPGRVSRGGAWRDSAGMCRSTCRIVFAPGTRKDSIGFRVAASVRAGQRSASTDGQRE